MFLTPPSLRDTPSLRRGSQQTPPRPRFIPHCGTRGKANAMSRGCRYRYITLVRSLHPCAIAHGVEMTVWCGSESEYYSHTPQWGVFGAWTSCHQLWTCDRGLSTFHLYIRSSALMSTSGLFCRSVCSASCGSDSWYAFFVVD